MQSDLGSIQFTKSPHFCGICRRQRHYEFNKVFGKSCIVFCAKPKEVDPIKLYATQIRFRGHSNIIKTSV